MTLQKDVMSPKCTKHSCTLSWSHSGGQDEIKTVELVIETTPANIDWTTKDKSSRGEHIIFITLLFRFAIDENIPTVAPPTNPSYTNCVFYGTYLPPSPPRY